LKNNLAEVIVITVWIDYFHQVIKDLKFLQEFNALYLQFNEYFDYIFGCCKESKP